jgi:galactitol-specific phosphotransferase system IIB component
LALINSPQLRTLFVLKQKVEKYEQAQNVQSKLQVCNQSKFENFSSSSKSKAVPTQN